MSFPAIRVLCWMTITHFANKPSNVTSLLSLEFGKLPFPASDPSIAYPLDSGR